MRNTIGTTTLPRGKGGRFWTLMALAAVFLFVLSFLAGYIIFTSNNTKPTPWQVDYKPNPTTLTDVQQQVAADSDTERPEDIPEINWLYQVKHRFTEFWGKHVSASSYVGTDEKTQKQAKDIFMAAFAWKENGKDWFNPLPVISFSEAYHRATGHTISDTGNFLDLIQESTDGNWYVGEKGVELFVNIDEIIRDDKTVLTTGELTGSEAARYFNTGSSANGVVYANAGGISGSNLVIWRITHYGDNGNVEWTIYMLVRCGNLIVASKPSGVKTGPTDNSNSNSPTVSVSTPSNRPKAQVQTPPRPVVNATAQTPRHPVTAITTQPSGGSSGSGGSGGHGSKPTVEAKNPEEDPSQTGNAGVDEGAGKNDDPGPGPAQATPPPSPPPTYTPPKTVPSGGNTQSGTANGGSGSSSSSSGGSDSSQSGTANGGSSTSSSSGGEGGNAAGSGSTSTTGNSSGSGGATITSGGDDGGF